MKKLILFLVFSLNMINLTACSSNLLGPSQSTENNNIAQPPTPSVAGPLPDDAMDKKPGFSEPTAVPPSSTVLAGDIQASMSKEDRPKLSHALDKALGKSTEWSNELTGIHYIVVPTKKVMVNDNHFCRKYTITATKNEATQEVSGTACVSEDGEWHEVND